MPGAGLSGRQPAGRGGWGSEPTPQPRGVDSSVFHVIFTQKSRAARAGQRCQGPKLCPAGAGPSGNVTKLGAQDPHAPAPALWDPHSHLPTVLHSAGCRSTLTQRRGQGSSLCWVSACGWLLRSECAPQSLLPWSLVPRWREAVGPFKALLGRGDCRSRRVRRSS